MEIKLTAAQLQCELQRHWRNYSIELWKKPKCSIIMKSYYYKCELGRIRGNRGKSFLDFYPKHDDGSFSSGLPHALRCDKNGDCYQYRFYTTNINKFRWVKIGRFVKINSK